MGPASGTSRQAIGDDDLVELVGLIREADSVELKLTIPEDRQRTAVSALGLDPLDAQIRQAFFFDTPDLKLNRSGVVVRARRIQGKGDDSVVKLRPVVPGDLPSSLRDSPDFGVEVDAMPGGFVCSGSFKGRPKKVPVRDVVTGTAPPRKLFSKGQRAFYASHAPDDVALDDLAVLGPVFVLKLKSSPRGYGRTLVSELWLYPDGSRVLELSTKCSTSEAFEVAAETRAFLAERGIELLGEQRPKTRTALEFFAGRLEG